MGMKPSGGMSYAECRILGDLLRTGMGCTVLGSGLKSGSGIRTGPGLTVLVRAGCAVAEAGRGVATGSMGPDSTIGARSGASLLISTLGSIPFPLLRPKNLLITRR